MKHIALITGASSGLGREFARLLAQEAVDALWLVARREERLRELAAEVALPCRVFALDLTQESALEELSAALSAEPVTVRWLVNAAGLFSVKQISPFSSSEFPIVIVGKSPLSAGLVRKQVPLLHPAA